MPRRKAEDAELTRQAIFASARKLFAEKGFAETSVQEISCAAGVTTGALFHYFDSKKDLFTRIVVRLHKLLHQEIALAAAHGDGPMDQFMRGNRASIELTQSPEYQRIIFIDAPAVMGIDEWRDLDQRLGMALVEGGLKLVSGTKELPDQLLKPMAVMVLGTMNELTFALIRKERGVDPGQCLELLEATINTWLERSVFPWKRAQTLERQARV